MAHFSSSLVFKMNRPALPRTWKTFLFSALTFASSSTKPFRKRRVVHICQIIWIMRHFEWYFNTVQNSCLKIFSKYFSKYWTIGNLHYSCFCSNVLRFLQLFSMELKSCCLALLCVHNCLKIHKNPPKCTCINNFTWVLLVVRILPSK